MSGDDSHVTEEGFCSESYFVECAHGRTYGSTPQEARELHQVKHARELVVRGPDPDPALVDGEP